MPVIDYTISVSNIITVLCVTGSVMGLLYSMKGDILIVKNDLHYLQESHKTLTEAFRQLGKVLTQVAIQDHRIANMEKKMDEMAHGHGFIKQ